MTISRTLPESFYCREEGGKKKAKRGPRPGQSRQRASTFPTRNQKLRKLCKNLRERGEPFQAPSRRRKPPFLSSSGPPGRAWGRGEPETGVCEGADQLESGLAKSTGVATTASFASPHEKRGRRGDRRRAFLLFGVIPRLFSFPTFFFFLDQVEKRPALFVPLRSPLLAAEAAVGRSPCAPGAGSLGKS